MLRSVLLMFLVAFSVSVNAQGVNYNYVQGSYGLVNLDGPGLDVDGDGFGLSASFAIDENFHVFGEYQSADSSFVGDLDLMEFGVGYHTNISPNMDVYANLGYLEFETYGGGGGGGCPIGVACTSSGGGAGDNDALAVGLGLRGAVSEAVELFGGIDYIEFDDSHNETRANAGFVLRLTEKLGVGLKATFWDDVNIYQFNARFYFE
jgi:hypothetical protein